MQWAYFTNLIRLEAFIEESQSKEFLNLWRYFQTSDHLYYMFSSGGGPGEVHSYFSPFSSPTDAFIVTQATIFDFENRISSTILTANEPFLFYYGSKKENFTGIMVWSLKGFMNAINKVDIKSIEFHNQRDDFRSWVKHSFKDKKLSDCLKDIRKQKIKGKKLRAKIFNKISKRFEELQSYSKDALHLS